MHGNLGDKRGVVERNQASGEARVVFGERGRVREGGSGARADRQHIGAVVRWRVGKMGQKLRKRTGVSTC